MHPLCFHRVCTALTACLRCKDISKTIVQFPYKCHRGPQCLHNDPCVRVQSSYSVVGDLTARLWRPHCALFERCGMPSHGVCFEHAQSSRRRSAFYVIPQRLLAIPLRCCGDACDRTAGTSALYIFLGRRGVAVRTLLWCERGLSPLVSVVIPFEPVLEIPTMWYVRPAKPQISLRIHAV